MTLTRDIGARSTVEAARDGDIETWQLLFEQHYGPLLGFFRARTPEDWVAEDLAAEVFAEAWRSRESLRWRNRPFGAWLFGIARHTLASHYRRRKVSTMRLADEEWHDLMPPRDQTLPGGSLSTELWDLLRSLPDDYRRAIELRFVVGLSGSEAAATMDRTPGAYRTLLYRALLAARTAMTEPRTTTTSSDR